MDSIHSSPISVRLHNYSHEYDSTAECCSVCEEESQDLTSMDITPTPSEVSDNFNHNINDNILNNKSDNNMNNNSNNNSNAFNNYRNNLNVSNVSPLDPKLSTIMKQSNCRSVAPVVDKQFSYDQKISDIESQNRELKRKKSIIFRLYSNNGSTRRKPVATRLSILGRPIPLYHMKNDINCYREKIAVYNFLSRPQGKVAIGYHLFVSVVVSLCLLLTIFSTISGKYMLKFKFSKIELIFIKNIKCFSQFVTENM